MPSVEKVIVWLLVGLISGSLAALVITWQRAGFRTSKQSRIGLGWRSRWRLSILAV